MAGPRLRIPGLKGGTLGVSYYMTRYMTPRVSQKGTFPQGGEDVSGSSGDWAQVLKMVSERIRHRHPTPPLKNQSSNLCLSGMALQHKHWEACLGQDTGFNFQKTVGLGYRKLYC